jgi:hypothetical protein
MIAPHFAPRLVPEAFVKLPDVQLPPIISSVPFTAMAFPSPPLVFRGLTASNQFIPSSETDIVFVDHCPVVTQIDPVQAISFAIGVVIITLPPGLVGTIHVRPPSDEYIIVPAYVPIIVSYVALIVPHIATFKPFTAMLLADPEMIIELLGLAK